jgi:Ca-activated chloride channel family protein
MKSYKKVMALLMGTALLTGTLSGCGNTATEQAASKDTNEYFMCTEETAPCAGAEVPYDSNAKYIVMPQDTDFNTESYEKPEENGFYVTTMEPLSTFAADVDTASYSNVRRMIENGYSLKDINPDAVRPEEFINYFKYDLNSPKDGEKFGITTEVSSCPWNEDHQLMFVGMKTEDIDLDEAPVNNLVFLIDVSGSMFDENKLPLLQKSFKELVYNLPDEGCVSIVTYASGEKVVLSGESLANKQVIADAIDSLSAGGSTNGEAGIQKAYEIAANNYIDGGNNRVILATDGDLNVGISDVSELEKFIKTKKDNGVFLSVLGFGSGNYKDDKMEKLADCGNGNYAYIDSFFEAKKVLVEGHALCRQRYRAVKGRYDRTGA